MPTVLWQMPKQNPILIGSGVTIAPNNQQIKPLINALAASGRHAPGLGR